jgi:ubiquinone/menaquinone biosynthesis C-methylase UbiE
MKTLRESMARVVIGQFHKPSGLLGRVAGVIMANRSSNVDRIRWTVDLLGLEPDDRVLEVGYGPGVGIAFAANKVTAGRVVGIDHSSLMQRQALTRNAVAARAGRVELLLGGGIEMLPTLAEPFDKAFAVNVLGLLGDRRTALAAIKRVLKPNGLLAVTSMPRHPGASPQDADRTASALASEFAEVGFHDVHVEKLPLEPMPAICVLGRA